MKLSSTILHNQYQTLKSTLWFEAPVAEIESPKLLLWNSHLAEQLSLHELNSLPSQDKALIFSGQRLLPGSQAAALAYAGHQFGQFNPQMGDGRAHYLGSFEVAEQLIDLQLKGSGLTPFSWRGDGLCALGPAVREYLMSEAMAALGVSTTRSLSVVSSGYGVRRRRLEEGAVVSRLAQSHIRFGSFQYLSARQDAQGLQQLLDLAIARHYPELQLIDDLEQKVQAFFNAVLEKQTALVVDWYRVGFIHGVMNTDNMLVSGETIDYGPCAMLGVYQPDTVYSSIDHAGRYAFSQQKRVLQWNLARLAESLLSLLPARGRQHIPLYEQRLLDFSADFDQAYQKMLLAKCGLGEDESAKPLPQQFLEWLQLHQMDYTQSFSRLTDSLIADRAPAEYPEGLQQWWHHWRQCIAQLNQDLVQVRQRMRQQNPYIIPRNHLVEQVIESVEETHDTALVDEFLIAMRQPYEWNESTQGFDRTDAPFDRAYQTFCGT